jgi:hypothetical protein
MAGMKTILLEAVIALQKVIDASGTVEQVLELLDHNQDFQLQNIERETR